MTICDLRNLHKEVAHANTQTAESESVSPGF